MVRQTWLARQVLERFLSLPFAAFVAFMALSLTFAVVALVAASTTSAHLDAAHTLASVASVMSHIRFDPCPGGAGSSC